MARSVEIARAFVAIESDTKGLDQGLAQAEKALGRTAKFVLDHPIAALTGLGTAAIAAGLKLASMAEEVDKNFHLIGASIPDATNRLKDLRAEASNLSVGFGISQKEISAGMLALARTGIESVDDLIVANRAAVAAARATGTDFGTVISLLDSALDAFGLSAKDSEKILAKLFVTSQGKTSFAELAPIFQAVGKAAVKSGVDWTTLTEAAVTLKDQGLNTKAIITALTKGLSEEGTPAIRKLAEASHVASDGVREMAEQTARMNATAEVAQAQLKERFNAQLLDLGRTILPIVTESMQGLVHLFDKLFGGAQERDVKLQVASQTIATLGRELSKLKGEKHDEAFMALTKSINDFFGASVATGKSISDLSDNQLKSLQIGLTAAGEAAKDGSAGSKQLATQLAVITDEITKRGNKPIVPPVTDKDKKGLKDLTAGLLATGDAAKDAAKKAEEAAKKQMAARTALFDLEKETGKTILTLAERQVALREELETQLSEKLKNLQGDQLIHAQAAVKQTVEEFAGRMKQADAVIKEGYQPRVQLTAVTDTLRHTQSDLNAAVDRGTTSYRAMGEAEEDEAEKQQVFRDKIIGVTQDVGDFAQAMKHVVTELGGADDTFLAVADGITNIADGIGRIAGGDVLGGVASAIGGLAGIARTIFGGESESARRVRVELERTQAELERHRQTLGDLIEVTQPGAKTLSIAGGVENILAVWKEMQAKGGVASVLLGVDPTTVGKELAKLGLTIADLEDLAKQLGIDLHPGGSAFFNTAQLNALLADLGARDAGFAQTFAGQRERIRGRQQLTDAGPATQLTDLLDLVTGGFGSPAIAQALAGAKFGTAEDRGATIEKLLALFDRSNLSTAELGGLNLQQFRDVLQELADLIRQIGEVGAVVPDIPLTPEQPPIALNLAGAEALPVEPIAAPVFTPDLEAANWEELLGLQRNAESHLANIAERLNLPPLEAPAIPSGALVGGSAAGGGGLSITVEINGDIHLSGGTPGESLSDQVDELVRTIEERMANNLRFRQLATGRTTIS